MFHGIPRAILDRMRYLEQMDARDRADGTPRKQRLRQIPPETGKFIALLAASTPEGTWFEVGTSAGYSTLWLVLAAREMGRQVTTVEISPEKLKLARETFRLAEVEPLVELLEGDAQALIPYDHIAFGFLDAEKEIYEACYKLLVPRMVSGGLLMADNAINHYDTLKPMLDHALNDDRVDALVVPIGKGILLCRRH